MKRATWFLAGAIVLVTSQSSWAQGEPPQGDAPPGDCPSRVGIEPTDAQWPYVYQDFDYYGGGGDKIVLGWSSLGTYIEYERELLDPDSLNRCEPQLGDASYTLYRPDGTTEVIPAGEGFDANPDFACFWWAYFHAWQDAPPLEDLMYCPAEVEYPDWNADAETYMSSAFDDAEFVDEEGVPL